MLVLNLLHQLHMDFDLFNVFYSVCSSIFEDEISKAIPDKKLALKNQINSVVE